MALSVTVARACAGKTGNAARAARMTTPNFKKAFPSTASAGPANIPPLRLAAASESADGKRSEEHTSELQSLMRISYAVFCLKKKTQQTISNKTHHILHTLKNTEINEMT